ncbi:MAG: hypothetical protein VX320_06560 [Candidatus Thermoplasmatota archaeon]|nr:hypothetical protein [Candidatus Thermoplasmatota archaeon]
MARQKVGSALTVLGLLIFSLLAISAPTSGQDNGVGVMQSDEAKNLTYTQNIMKMFGSNNDGGAQSSWPMWTHSASSDSDSDDSVGEVNAIGDPNNGGGPRTFTWEGSNPPAEPVPIDKSSPIFGQIRLSIICNLEQDSCTKQVTIVLRLGNSDIAQQVIDTPDENNVYSFEFLSHNIEEIPAGEALGLRITFQKPQSPTDGYTLYLGSGNDGSWMNVPVLPPYVESIPGLSGEDYKSPYSGARGFDAVGASTTSWFGLIFWCLFSIGIFVGGFALLPPIPYKEISILATGMGLLASMFVAPFISGPILTGLAANPDDKDIWTVEEIAKLEEREGTFLGDELVVGYSFKFYAEYDGVYTTTDEGESISGLGYESDAATLGDPETSRRGKEFVQLYFSLFHADLRPGQAVLADIEIINTTDLNTGQEVIVPLHADPNSVDTQVVVVSVNGIDSIRYAIPHEVCTIIGQDFSWQYYPILVTAVGLLLGGIGFWQVFKSDRVEEDDDDWEDDEELEDVLDEFEDDDEDDDLDDLDDLDDI